MLRISDVRGNSSRKREWGLQVENTINKRGPGCRPKTFQAYISIGVSLSHFLQRLAVAGVFCRTVNAAIKYQINVSQV